MAVDKLRSTLKMEALCHRSVQILHIGFSFCCHRWCRPEGEVKYLSIMGNEQVARSEHTWHHFQHQGCFTVDHLCQACLRHGDVTQLGDKVVRFIIQLGADKGGMYSYAWLENLINCHQVNADRIHPQWQNLQVGDLVRMCPEGFCPSPFTVARVGPLYTVVMGHQDNGAWTDLWQFVIEPQADGASRLILRTRTNMTGGIWSIIHPGVFVMERGMLLGIKDRAEAMAGQ